MKPAHALLALAITLLWGYNFIVAKLGVEHFPPVLFAGLRYVVVAAMLLPWLKPLPGQMGRVLLIGLTAGALNFGLVLVAYSLTDHVGSIAIAMQFSIPFMVILAVVFLGERIGIYRTAGTIIAFVGIMIIGFDPRAFDSPLAFAIVCTGAGFFAISVVLMRKLNGGHPMQIQAWVAVVSAPFLLVVSFLMEEGHMVHVMESHWEGWLYVAYAAIGGTVIGHGGMFFLLQRYAVTFLVPVMIAPPVLGVVFGLWLNDDPMTLRIALGGLMAMGGVGIIQVREAMKSRQKKVAESELAEPVL